MQVQPPGTDDELVVLSEQVPAPSDANAAIVFVAAIFAGLCGMIFGVGLLLGAPIILYGSALAIGLLSMAVAVRRYFFGRYPDIIAIEPRDLPVETKNLGRPPISDIKPVDRRRLLTGTLIGAGGLMGAGLLAPVVSLGPAPGNELRVTPWGPGVRVVGNDGLPLRPEFLASGGVLSAWPDGAIGFERAAVLVIRLSEPPIPPTNLDWVVDGSVLAYSKICTHAGCPVALFRERDNALFCPCHQSTFNVREGARVAFGPAYRPLPQLPLGVDQEGFLVALDDFQEQAGPAFG